MKLSLITAVASILTTPAVATAPKDISKVIYVFDADYAGGVDGTIETSWDAGVMCDRVTIKADLRFHRVDLNALAKADGNCTGPVKEYAWRIHTKWGQPADTPSGSASYQQCSKAITGNHYDPNKACGPASEYADTPDCASKIKNYQCTPKRYHEDVSNCEMGDLSGKLGTLKPNRKGEVKATWTDSLYPRFDAHQPTWNIVIHAVCGKATPRLACAVGHKISPKKVLLRIAESKQRHDGHDHGHHEDHDTDDEEGNDEGDDETNDEDHEEGNHEEDNDEEDRDGDLDEHNENDDDHDGDHDGDEY